MQHLHCKLCKCRFCITLVCKCDFCKRLHYVYVYVFVFVYDLKREVRCTRTADKPPAPQHLILEAGIFENRALSEQAEKNFNFFLFLRLTIRRAGFIF